MKEVQDPFTSGSDWPFRRENPKARSNTVQTNRLESMGSNKFNSLLKLSPTSSKGQVAASELSFLGIALGARADSPFWRATAGPLPRNEKLSTEEVFHALLAEANQEFANLLRDVQAASHHFSGRVNGPPMSDLLIRAVRCAAKQYMLQAELGSLALTDELTGLYNRRGFQAIADRHLKLARRCGKGLLLFFLDVDGLKQVNDSRGHREGDRVLKSVSVALLKTFRDSDVIARLGGDEFAVLAIEASGQGEDTIRQRLCEFLKPKDEQDSVSAISVSLGITRYDPRKGVSLEELMAQADAGMYDEKKAKRGRGKSRADVSV